MSPDLSEVSEVWAGEEIIRHFKIELGSKNPLDCKIFDAYMLKVGKLYKKGEADLLVRARFVVISRTNTMVVFSPYTKGDPEKPVTLKMALIAFGSYDEKDVFCYGEVLEQRENGVTRVRYLTESFLRPVAREPFPNSDPPRIGITLLDKLGNRNFVFRGGENAQGIVDRYY